MTAAVRVDIAGAEVEQLDISLRGSILCEAAVVRSSTLRCMLRAVFAELMLQKIEILPT